MLWSRPFLRAHENPPQRPFVRRRLPMHASPLVALFARMRQRRVAHPLPVVPGLTRAPPGARFAGRGRRPRARTRPSRWGRSRAPAPRSTQPGSDRVTPSTCACCDGGVDELLSQVVVADALDAPARFAHRARSRRPAGRTSSGGHHQRFTASCTIARCSACPRASSFSVEALALVEALLAADAHHRARVRRVGAARQRHLVHDRRAVDQPADGCPMSAQVSVG